jgi:Nucleotidyltransferase of unknown function (DUF6036)
MTKNQFEDLLLRASEIARDCDFFLIGSQALLGSCSSIPRDFPKTIEADLYPRRRPEAWVLLRNRLGKGSSFFKRNGYHIDCTDPTLATLPEGWVERLVPFRSRRARGVTAWCLDAHDLFVSKLAVSREKDMAFLRKMLQHKFVKPATVLQRIHELPIHASRIEDLRAQTQSLLAEARIGLKSKPRFSRGNTVKRK